MAADSLVDRLQRLEGSDWQPRPPAAPEAVAALEAKYKILLPPDYRELLLASSGGSLSGHPTKINFESATDLFWHNEDPRFTAALPGMFVIGDDNGDAIYYYDPANARGKGAYAVFQVDLSMLGAPYSKFAGATLTELVDAILADESIWDRRYLGPIGIPDPAHPPST